MVDHVENQVGRQVGHYRLVRLLGQGGFANIYLGEHIYLKTFAAIKLLRMRLVKDELQGFLVEARTIANLAHPHIVRVLDFGVEDDIPFLVMEYAPNGTLRDRHPKGTRLHPSEVVSYIKQVAEALQYAHERRIIHRDIKPANMLLGSKGEVLLSDFGIALVNQSSHYQNAHEVVGTAAYMAPEQLQGRPRPASDQYALATVVYEWLSGNRPFQGTFIELYSQQMFAEPAPLYGRYPNITRDIEQVVMIALSKDPHQRFASIQAFANALEKACLPAQHNHPAHLAVTPFVPGQQQTIDYATTPLQPFYSQHQVHLPNQVQQPPFTPMPQGQWPQSPFTPMPLIQDSQSSQRKISRRAVLAGLASVGLAILVGVGLVELVLSGNDSSSSGTTSSGKWSPVGNLLLARIHFRATTLMSGAVLIEGGLISGDYATESELFNPITGTWTKTGNLHDGRSGHTATLLNDGSVLIVGGVAGPALASSELYRPSGVWLRAPSMQQARTRHTATLLANGKVLVVGGWSGGKLLSSAELYDPDTKSWSSAGNMKIRRADHSAVLLSDGKVLVVGGQPVKDKQTAEAELYNPATNTWTSTSSMNIPRLDFALVLLGNKKVLAIGGQTPNGQTATVELYDPATAKWSMMSRMHYPRSGLRDQGAVLLQNGHVLLAGADILGTSEVYDPTTNTWSAPIRMADSHCDGASTLLQDGRVLVTGGYNCSSRDTLLTSTIIYS